MKKLLTHKLSLLVGVLILCNVGFVIYYLDQRQFVNKGVLFGLSMGCINLMLVWYIFRQMHTFNQEVHERISRSYLNAEAICLINETIKPVSRLPAMTGYAVSASAMLYVYDLLEREKPRLIVELGSGVSTLIMGYWAVRNNATIMSIENHVQHRQQVLSWVRDHKLESNVQIHHAELIDYDLSGQKFRWYNSNVFKHVKHIDFLFIDGPVGTLQPHSRYPAMPMLIEKLTDTAVLVLDDAARKDEQEVIKKWTRQFPDWQETYRLLDGKGICVLRQ